jgi:hypothetical protein
MYQHRFDESRQHLFHPDNAEQLKKACADMEARLPTLLINAGFPEEHIPLIEKMEQVVFDCIRWGHFPLRVQVSANVVKDEPDAELFASQHERIQERFEREFEYFSRPFYQFTAGDNWWEGESLFLVCDANSYLMHCKYESELRFEDLRGYKPKKRGRPRNDAAHAAKEEQAGRYKEWIESCRAYKKEVLDKTNELKTSELAVREQVQAIERECAARIAEVQRLVQEQRVALNVLKARGAPKWIP